MVLDDLLLMINYNLIKNMISVIFEKKNRFIFFISFQNTDKQEFTL